MLKKKLFIDSPILEPSLGENRQFAREEDGCSQIGLAADMRQPVGLVAAVDGGNGRGVARADATVGRESKAAQVKIVLAADDDVYRDNGKEPEIGADLGYWDLDGAIGPESVKAARKGMEFSTVRAEGGRLRATCK